MFQVELLKLLLSLEPRDPFGAILVIDYYILRARQVCCVLYIAHSSIVVAQFELLQAMFERTDLSFGGVQCNEAS